MRWGLCRRRNSSHSLPLVGKVRSRISPGGRKAVGYVLKEKQESAWQWATRRQWAFLRVGMVRQEQRHQSERNHLVWGGWGWQERGVRLLILAVDYWEDCVWYLLELCVGGHESRKGSSRTCCQRESSGLDITSFTGEH